MPTEPHIVRDLGAKLSDDIAGNCRRLMALVPTSDAEAQFRIALTGFSGLFPYLLEAERRAAARPSAADVSNEEVWLICLSLARTFSGHSNPVRQAKLDVAFFKAMGGLDG